MTPTGLASSLSQIVLDVRDLQKTMEFYHDVLDLAVLGIEDMGGHRMAHLNGGGTEILLIQQPDFVLAAGQSGIMLNFRVANLDRLIMRGDLLVLRPVETGAAGRSILVADPDGNPILISERSETIH